MKKVAKLMALILVLATALSLCVNAVAEEQSTLDRILEQGYITCGCSLGGMPVGGYDDNGEPTGYDVDWAKKLAEVLGVELRIVDCNGDTRIPLLTSGQVDCLFANVTGNLTRAQTIDFSIPYLRCGIKMLTQAGSKYKVITDLNTPEAKVAVGRGTTNEQLILEYAPNATIIYTDGTTEQLMLLEQGRVDAYLEDSTTVDYAAGNSNGKLEAQDKLYTSDPICIGARKGDIEWVRFLDMFVSWQISSGWQAETYYKWWGTYPSGMTYIW